jgi:hypothetical protein
MEINRGQSFPYSSGKEETKTSIWKQDEWEGTNK